MPRFLIVDLHALWLIGGLTALAVAAALLFLRALHAPSARVLGLLALAHAVGGVGLLASSASTSRADSLGAAVGDTLVAAAMVIGCEAARLLYSARPRPALLSTILFALAAGSLGFDLMRSEPSVRLALQAWLVAGVAILTAVRIAHARDDAAEPIRRLLVLTGFGCAAVWLMRSGLALEAIGSGGAHLASAGLAETFGATFAVLIPAIVIALMLMVVHARMADELRALATIDPLTRLMSRRVLFEQGGALLASLQLAGRPVAAMMVDLDHFKRINDRHGHAAGDLVLHHCARQLRSGSRAEALVARYGGEEFCLLVPLDRASDAFVAAERLRHRIESQPCTLDGQSLHVTISIGVAIHQSGQGLAQLLEQADALLYEAKRAGRNRVVTTDAAASQPDLALPVV